MRHLILDQNPKQNGQLQGETFAKEIQELAAIRGKLITNVLRDFSPEKIHDLALAQVEELKKIPGFYEEFMGHL